MGNRSISNEKYGTSYPFYETTANDVVVNCIMSHVVSCTIYLPPYMLPPVRISDVMVNRTNMSVNLSIKDKNNALLGYAVLESSVLSANTAYIQVPIMSADSILQGFIEIEKGSTFIRELSTGLSGALSYMVPKKALQILPYCTHSVQTPRPGAVKLGSEVADYIYLKRGLLFNNVTVESSGYFTSDFSISLYAETPIGDIELVPIKAINGLNTKDIVWITQKDELQDITVKTYDYILIQGWTEQGSGRTQ